MTHASGTILAGRYRLLNIAGRGGMAEVWRAEVVGAAGFRRPVAIKRVMPGACDEAMAREMFVEEARVGAALDHPNIVQVYDLGEDADGLFLVMEWVDGVTVRELVDHYAARRRAPPPALVGSVGVAMLEALHSAHTREPGPVIHRDVSPANVMISRRGAVKLTDFGLARAFDRPSMTPVDIVKGKLAYLAPELLRGAPCTVRSDVYSAANVLWELLCARRIYHDVRDNEIVHAKLAGRACPSVRSERPEVSAAFAAAIDRGLATAPGERFETALAFARALDGAMRKSTRFDLGEVVREARPAPSEASGEHASSVETLPGDAVVEIA